MTPDKHNIEKALKHSFPSASNEQVESSRDKIYERLRAVATEIPTTAASLQPRTIRWGWAVALTAAAMVVFAATIWVGTHKDRVEIGDVVRSSDTNGREIVLPDGSRVEMKLRAQLSLEQASDGIRIRLDHGGVIVSAAKQHAGRHLYVQTKDVTVSVVGTVFSVTAEAKGSRVAVYEGEVRVQQGSTEKKLGPGEQLQVASLTQPVAPQKATPKRETFDTTSIRLASGPIQPGERGGAVNVNIEGCSGGSAIGIDPGRLSMSYKNIYTVISLAYFSGAGSICMYVNRLGLLTGGPRWIHSDGYDILAVFPEGSFSSTPPVDDPKVQKMLQTMLEERFKLVVTRQMKEMTVYVMTLKDPSKVDASKGPVWLTKTMAEQKPEIAQFQQTMLGQQNLVAQEGGALYGANATMANLSVMLGRMLGQPVVDRTNFTGKFHFSLEILRDPPPFQSPLLGPRNPGEIKSIIAEFEKQAGIKLELTKDKVEVLNIESIDRPSEN